MTALTTKSDAELVNVDRHDWPVEVQGLRNDRERQFVLTFLETNNGANAARASGYGNEAGTSTAETYARIAFRLLHTDRIVEAIQAMVKRDIRTLGPAAHKAMKLILDTPFHPQAARVALALAEKIEPTRQVVSGEIKHVHSLDHEAEALAQLRSLIALGVAREKLAEVFGEFGLQRLEAKIESEEKPVIDAEYVEIARDPDADLLGE